MKKKSSSGFNGRRFVNSYAAAVPFHIMGRWLLKRERPKWPKEGLVTPLSHEEGDIRLTRLHHSTCLIEMGGLTMITDPIWSKVCGPLGLLGPKRLVKLSTDLHELPKIDIIFLSHNHFDHMCLRTLRALQKRYNPLVITGLGNGRYLRRIPFKKVIELDWWQEAHIGSLKVTYVPSSHFSARGLFDRFKALWGGFVIEREDKKVYFAGDSGWADHFQEIADCFAPIDYCFLPIGSYKPEKVLEPVHIGPKEAVRLHRLFQATGSLPIHFCTYQLGDEGWTEPIEVLKKELDLYGLPHSSFGI